jgi:hypothetical protein
VPRYRVVFANTRTSSVEVEADDESDAVDKALESETFQNLPGLCAHCSGWSEKFSVDDGAWDVLGDGAERIE